MSRWWAESVVVAPDDVAGAARSTQVVLASFEAEIAGLRIPAGTRIVAVVAGEAVRLRLVPWSDALTSPHERHVLSSQSFVEAYGEAARGWVVCERAVNFNRATVAAALDGALLEGLEALASKNRLHLVSVQPAFTRAFDARRRRLQADPAWFVWMERHVTTALLVSARAPVHLRRYAAPHADLATLLAREWFTLGRDDAPCPAYVDRAGNALAAEPMTQPAVDSRLRIIDLGRAAPAIDVRETERA